VLSGGPQATAARAAQPSEEVARSARPHRVAEGPPRALWKISGFRRRLPGGGGALEVRQPGRRLLRRVPPALPFVGGWRSPADTSRPISA